MGVLKLLDAGAQMIWHEGRTTSRAEGQPTVDVAQIHMVHAGPAAYFEAA